MARGVHRRVRRPRGYRGAPCARARVHRSVRSVETFVVGGEMWVNDSFASHYQEYTFVILSSSSGAIGHVPAFRDRASGGQARALIYGYGCALSTCRAPPFVCLALWVGVNSIFSV